MSRADELRERFWAFHEANPSVLDRLIQMTDEARARGLEKVGIRMLFEVLRWERTVMVDRGDDEFRLNNSNRAFYVRLIQQVRPDLAGMFETRRSAAERHVDAVEQAFDEDDAGQLRIA